MERNFTITTSSQRHYLMFVWHPLISIRFPERCRKIRLWKPIWLFFGLFMKVRFHETSKKKVKFPSKKKKGFLSPKSIPVVIKNTFYLCHSKRLIHHRSTYGIRLTKYVEFLSWINDKSSLRVLRLINKSRTNVDL